MLPFASQSGNPVLGLLLLPLFLAGPFVLLWLEVRAYLRSEAQSWLPLGLMVALGILACLYGYGEGLSGFQQARGFSKAQILATWIGAVAFPFTLAWEAYKRGWFERRQQRKKSKRTSEPG